MAEAEVSYIHTVSQSVHMEAKLKFNSPIVDVTRIRKFLNNGANVITSGFQSNNAMLDNVLQKGEAVDEILHIRNWPGPRSRRPVAARKHKDVE